MKIHETPLAMKACAKDAQQSEGANLASHGRIQLRRNLECPSISNHTLLDYGKIMEVNAIVRIPLVFHELLDVALMCGKLWIGVAVMYHVCQESFV